MPDLLDPSARRVVDLDSTRVTLLRYPEMRTLLLPILLALSGAGCKRGPSAAERAAGVGATVDTRVPREGVAVSDSRRKLALPVVLRAFLLSEADAAKAPIAFVGAGEAAIARDERTGICALLFERPSSEWALHSRSKGPLPDPSELDMPLHTSGTLQGGVTQGDVRQYYDEYCR
jgi:hypothetical protein